MSLHLCDNISDNPLGRSTTKRTRPVTRVLPALVFYLRSSYFTSAHRWLWKTRELDDFIYQELQRVTAVPRWCTYCFCKNGLAFTPSGCFLKTHPLLFQKHATVFQLALSPCPHLDSEGRACANKSLLHFEPTHNRNGIWHTNFYGITLGI